MDTRTSDLGRGDRINLRAEAMANNAFRRVVHTGRHEQVTVMALPPDGEIGEEIHADSDQLFVIVDGTGEARVGDLVLGVWPGDLVFVPAGTRHNMRNRAVAPLRLVTVHAPPLHDPGTVHASRADAHADGDAG